MSDLSGYQPKLYGAFNTADHVGDHVEAVRRCRNTIPELTGITATPHYLKQVHGTRVVKVGGQRDTQIQTADGCWTDIPGQICCVHTADCLPVLFADQSGSRVAIAHAGWRGLAKGILQNTANMFEDPSQVLVWLGPAIGPASFEVGSDVFAAFVSQCPSHENCFQPTNHPDHWLCDIYQLASNILKSVGVSVIYGGGLDTLTDPRFFSFRKQPQCGRMLSAIWIDPAQ